MNKSSEKFVISELRYTDSFGINMHELIKISSILRSRKDASPGYGSEISQWVLQLDELVVSQNSRNAGNLTWIQRKFGDEELSNCIMH